MIQAQTEKYKLYSPSMLFDVIAVACLVSMSLIWNRAEGVFAVSVLLPLAWRLKGCDFRALFVRHRPSLLMFYAFITYFLIQTFISNPLSVTEMGLIDSQQGYLLNIAIIYCVAFLSFQTSKTMPFVVRFFLPVLLALCSVFMAYYSYTQQGCRALMFFSTSPYIPSYIFGGLSLLTFVNWRMFTKAERLLRYYLLTAAVFLCLGPFGSRGILLALIVATSLLVIVSIWRRDHLVPNGVLLIFSCILGSLGAFGYLFIKGCVGMLDRYQDYFSLLEENIQLIGLITCTGIIAGWLYIKYWRGEKVKVTSQFLTMTFIFVLMLCLFCTTFFNLQELNPAQSFGDDSNKHRALMWTGALSAVKGNIWFGLGAFGESFVLDSHELLGDAAGLYTAVHSQVLTWLTIGGLVGVGLASFAMVSPFLFAKNNKNPDISVALICGPAFFLAATATESISARPALLYFMVIVILLSATLIDKEDSC